MDSSIRAWRSTCSGRRGRSAAGAGGARPPFLPLPDREYLRWRMYTAYADEAAVPPAGRRGPVRALAAGDDGALMADGTGDAASSTEPPTS